MDGKAQVRVAERIDRLWRFQVELPERAGGVYWNRQRGFSGEIHRHWHIGATRAFGDPAGRQAIIHDLQVTGRKKIKGKIEGIDEAASVRQLYPNPVCS